MNPSPVEDEKNFTTLGVAVPSRWRGEDVWKSGTSFATPIAAAFAANVLTFADYKCSLTLEKQKLLRKRRGMNAIFRKMSIKRDGYDFVHPKFLWKPNMNEQDVANVIENTLK
jgi:hypothetical protein